MPRSMASGSSISHYHVVSPLGAGGMGEVYLARDASLERSVALKILPPELVRNEERLRRFVQEARAASALSHPNIITIYEIGEGRVQQESDAQAPAAGAAAPPLHYIAMELVAGDTIDHKIHREKVDLKTLLGYLAQAADGLAKAHQSGIVHRDLKPENIMVTKDGFAKVLDFGLAKLTERETFPEGNVTVAASVAAKTIEGSILGTVGYMSPEQILGKTIDARSDVFSFGCILYEAITRQHAFKADSDIETMHQILREEPVPIEEVKPETPAELRRLVRRCLAKTPDQRLQSMKDLALELRDIIDEFDNLSASSASRMSRLSGATPVPQPRGRGSRLAVIAAIAVGLAGAALGIYGLSHRQSARGSRPAAFQSMQMTRLTNVGTVAVASLSSDGRYLAEVLADKGRWSLRVKQVATGSEVDIVPWQDDEIGDVSFSPDGEYLYYRSRDPQSPLYSALFQVASLGGTSRKILFDVDTAVTFSPDGRQMAFVRGYPTEGESALMVANSDGTSEHKLLVEKQPRSLSTEVDPSWSADGARIAAVLSHGGLEYEVAIIDAATGKQSGVGGKQWINVVGLDWLPDSHALVVAGLGRGSSLDLQLWEVHYPSGELRRITNDLNDYVGVSVTADSKKIATIQSQQISNLWVVPMSNQPAAKPILPGVGDDDISGFAVASDGRIVFEYQQDRFVHIQSMQLDGSGRRQLTSGTSLDFSPQVARDANLVLFTSLQQDAGVHVWTMNLDGAEPKQVTQGPGEVGIAIDPAGQWIVHTRVDSTRSLWRVPAGGGESIKFIEPAAGTIGFSPDGRKLAYFVLERQNDRIRQFLAIVPAGGGDPIAKLPVPGNSSNYRWAPPGDAFDCVREVDGKWNVWRQRLDGKEPEQLTHFDDQRIFRFDWTADGQQLVLSRGEIRRDVVLLTDFQ